MLTLFVLSFPISGAVISPKLSVSKRIPGTIVLLGSQEKITLQGFCLPDGSLWPSTRVTCHRGHPTMWCLVQCCVSSGTGFALCPLDIMPFSLIPRLSCLLTLLQGEIFSMPLGHLSFISTGRNSPHTIAPEVVQWRDINFCCPLPKAS